MQKAGDGLRWAAPWVWAQAFVQSLPLELLGLGMQVMGTACVSVMALCAKLAQQLGVPTFQVVFARSCILLLFSVALLVHARTDPFQTKRKGLLLARGLLGFGAVSMVYLTVSLLPLAEAAVLGFLSPIFVAVVGPCVLGEPATRGVVFALPLAVLGVLFVAQPSALFGGSSTALNPLGVATGILQAVLSASAKLTIRLLNSSEPLGSIVFSQSIVSFIGSAVLCMVLPTHFIIPPSAEVWLLLIGTGLCGCGVQTLNTLALKYSSAAPVLAMGYTAVLWGLLYDVTVFHHPPSLLALVGAALVCCSSFVVVWDQRRAAKIRQEAVGQQHGQHSYELVSSGAPSLDEEAGEPASPGQPLDLPAKQVNGTVLGSSPAQPQPITSSSSGSPGKTR